MTGMKLDNEELEQAKSLLRHDLRTPMSAVLGLTQMLMDELDGPLNTEQRVQVEMIHRAATSMMQLIETRLARSPHP